MPTVVRYLTFLAILAAVVYGAMLALALFVTPRQGEISERIQIEQPGAPPASPDGPP